MARKKRSQKRQGTASSKRSKPEPKRKSKKSPPKKYIVSSTPKSAPRPLRPLKESKYSKKQKLSKPVSPKPVERNFLKTKTYKKFSKKYKRGADKKYWKEIQTHFKQLYDKTGQPISIAKINIEKKFLRDTRNRFYKTKRTYWGKSKWTKGKDGKWKKGKPVKRMLWRDKLTGQWLRGKKVGKRLLKAMEPDLIRSFMQKKGLKNYQKARKRYLKSIKNKSLGKIMELYSTSP